MKKLLYLIFLFPVLVLAEDCQLEIEGNDVMQFNKKQLEVSKSCENITVKLIHTGKADKKIMGHNWVLVKTSDYSAVGPDSMSAGIENDFVKKDDARIIAYTKVIGGGEETSVTFPMSKLNASEKYTFLCTFPGHFALMKGDFIIKG